MFVEFEGKKPKVDSSAFIAPSAVLIGDVEVGPGASVWFGAVLRGDMGQIIIGGGTNIQDNCVVHGPVTVGSNCTVTHSVVLHSCNLGYGTFVGLNATVLDGAELGDQVMVAAGSVIKENDHVPSRVLMAGTPAAIIKELSGQALWWVDNGPKMYAELAQRYRKQGLGILPEAED